MKIALSDSQSDFQCYVQLDQGLSLRSTALIDRAGNQQQLSPWQVMPDFQTI
jgi:hypothetical protein